MNSSNNERSFDKRNSATTASETRCASVVVLRAFGTIRRRFERRDRPFVGLVRSICTELNDIPDRPSDLHARSKRINGDGTVPPRSRRCFRSRATKRSCTFPERSLRKRPSRTNGWRGRNDCRCVLFSSVAKCAERRSREEASSRWRIVFVLPSFPPDRTDESKEFCRDISQVEENLQFVARCQSCFVEIPVEQFDSLSSSSPRSTFVK